MNNEITVRGREVALPARTQALMREWRESPRKSYDSLPETISHEEIIRSDSPSLAQIKNHLSPDMAQMIVAMAIEDVNRLFRADRRMDAQDIVFTAKVILRRFWYLKPEDIKKCFNGRRPKLFVLEGDSFISWLAEYDLQRDNACEDMACNGNRYDPNPGAITHKAYMAMLESRANDGDEEARRTLADMRRRAAIPTAEERRKKDLGFFAFNEQYKKTKGYYDRDKSKEEPSGPQP